MDDLPTAIVTTAGVVFVGILAALFARERWPRGLRDAQRLSALLEKMDPSEERKFVADYRDDLAVKWVQAKFGADGGHWRVLALLGSILGFALFVGTVYSLVTASVVLWFSGESAAAHWFQVGIAYAIGASVFTLIAAVGAAIWGDKRTVYLAAVRSSRGMRKPLADSLSAVEKSLRKKPGDPQIDAHVTESPPAPPAAASD